VTLNQLQTDLHIFQIGELNQIKDFGKPFYLLRFALLQILAQRIIVDMDDESFEHELDSPFAYLRSLVQNLSTPGNGKGSSEHVRLGVLHQKSIFLLLASSFNRRSKQRGRCPAYYLVTR